MALISSASRTRVSLRSRHRATSTITRRLWVRLMVVCAIIIIIYLIFFIGFPTETWQTLAAVQDYVLFFVQPYTESYGADDWTRFQADYQRRFGRAPPVSLQQWHAYAKYRGCSETDFYDVLNQDLQTFRDQINSTGRRFSYSQVLLSGSQQTNNYIVFQLHNHDLQVIAHKHPFDPASFAVIQKNLRWMLTAVTRHSPPLKAVLFFDLHDHPTQQSTPDSMPLFSSCRMSYWTDDQPAPSEEQLLREGGPYSHATKQRKPIHPDYQTTSYDSRTLLVPYYWALDVSMFTSPGPPFVQRNNAIVWRGATTGYEWGVSPRFQLVLQHDTMPEETVQMDFAFTDIVQNMSTAHTLPPGTPMAPHMSDAETQQYKYIMDVDGNGKYK
jgi:hypothetical protein